MSATDNEPTPEQPANAGCGAMPCSRLKCEECGSELPATRRDDPHLTAVLAKNAGVWVKNFIIYGDESGYHYFCCKDHGSAWKAKHIPENV